MMQKKDAADSFPRLRGKAGMGGLRRFGCPHPNPPPLAGEGGEP